MKTMCAFFIVLAGIMIILQSTWTLQNTSALKTQLVEYDKSDRFHLLSYNVSELLTTCSRLRHQVLFLGVITDITKYCRWAQSFLEKFGFVQIKYTILGDVKVFPATTRPSRNPHTKLEGFIVIADSPTNLEYMLHRLRTTKWWTVDRWALLFDGETTITKCKNAHAFLNCSWNVNLLHSYFFCFENDGKIATYSYNPYAARAPELWEQVSISDAEGVVKPWTLFRRDLLFGKTLCADLSFDKTLRLSEYEYKVVGVPLAPGFVIHTDPNGTKNYGGLDSKIHCTFAAVVNATFSPTIAFGQEIGWVDPNGKSHHLLSNISAGNYEILINSMYTFNKYHSTLTYPHLDSGLAILTKFSGFESEHMKILKFMNPILLVGIVITLALTIFVLAVLNRYGLIQAFLEIMRLITNTTVNYRIRGTPLRLYMVTVVILFFITNSALQSDLAAILAKIQSKKNIEDLDDLRVSGYTIYMGLEYKNVIDDPVLKSRMRFTRSWNCSAHVVYEEKVACLADRYELMKITIDGMQFGYYLSRKNIASLSNAYVARPDWPLRDRFNQILSRLFEGGIIDLWKRQDAELFVQNSKAYRFWMKISMARELSIDNLSFAFKLLVCGIIGSTLTFIVECACFYYQTRNKPKVQIPLAC